MKTRFRLLKRNRSLKIGCARCCCFVVDASTRHNVSTKLDESRQSNKSEENKQSSFEQIHWNGTIVKSASIENMLTDLIETSLDNLVSNQQSMRFVSLNLSEQVKDLFKSFYIGQKIVSIVSVCDHFDQTIRFYSRFLWNPVHDRLVEKVIRKRSRLIVVVVFLVGKEWRFDTKAKELVCLFQSLKKWTIYWKRK